MADFKTFGDAVEKQFTKMVNGDNGARMFITNIDGDKLWDAYIAAFPEGTNPMYVNRTEHDCSCCRNFVRNIGNVISINDQGEVLTVWDEVKPDGADDMYVVVANAMAKLVKKAKIKSKFVSGESTYGASKAGGWNHFYAKIPSQYVTKDGAVVGKHLEDVGVLKRSLEEIDGDAIDTVLDLINQNSIYKGAEFLQSVKQFKSMQGVYSKLKPREKEFFLFMNANQYTRFRNTVIGTLMVDLSNGVNLDGAVASYEAKVAPTNYKRPTALVTPKMIDAAKKQVDALGIEESLHRRHAMRSDISINNVIFADNTVKELMIGGVFDNLKATKKAPVKELSKVDTVSIEKFLADIAPNAVEIELLYVNEMMNKHVSLVAPEHVSAPLLFKWDNGFSWSYDGEVTDSIKARVKKAGGKIDCDLGIRLSWHNSDDLDLSISGNNTRVYFGNRRGAGAVLDVDTNGMGPRNNIDPVENITWDKINQVPKGEFDIIVHQYSKNSKSNPGYEVEVELMGNVYALQCPNSPSDNSRICVGKVVSDGKGNVKIVSDMLVAGHASQDKWNLKTNEWIPVDMIMKSPNFWDDQKIGNEHVFFMLKDCKNPDDVRGFYNEFLREEMNTHRKVFELLASNMKAPYNDNQLSGVGFSLTNKDEITVRVKGAVNRVLKVSF